MRRPRGIWNCAQHLSVLWSHMNLSYHVTKKKIFTPYSCCTVFLLLYLCVFLCSLHQVYSHIMASDLFLHESQAPVTCRSHFGRKGGL